MPNVTIQSGGATTTFLTEQPVELQSDIRKGSVTTRRWRGDSNSIQTKAFTLRQFGWVVNIKAGPVWELEARLPQDDLTGNPETQEATTQWELSGNAFEKDLLNANVTAVNNLSAHDLRLLREICDNKWDAADGATSPGFTDLSSGDPRGLFNLWLAGMKSVQMFEPVLRVNAMVSPQFAIPNSLANVGSVYSTTALKASLVLPPGIEANLPAGGSVSRTGDSSTTISLYGGWLKYAPTITQSAAFKVQIQQEWHFGLWPTLIYTLIS